MRKRLRIFSGMYFGFYLIAADQAAWLSKTKSGKWSLCASDNKAFQFRSRREASEFADAWNARIKQDVSRWLTVEEVK